MRFRREGSIFESRGRDRNDVRTSNNDFRTSNTGFRSGRRE